MRLNKDSRSETERKSRLVPIIYMVVRFMNAGGTIAVGLKAKRGSTDGALISVDQIPAA